MISVGKGLIGIGAGIAVLTGLMTGLGQGLAASKAVEAVGKNPEAATQIRSMLVVGCAIAESCAIYGMLVAFLLIFVFGA
ncbi:MAG: ATP synthase F0 subunit C [Erysipelotrichaceae bacterium]|nr:ATP synthase F0 subunit C [Erysipelotrichaceae bacterium]